MKSNNCNIMWFNLPLINIYLFFILEINNFKLIEALCFNKFY